MNKEIEQEQSKPKLWNPNSAALWNLLLSPAFGAFIHAINWKTMGAQDRAKINMLWGWFIIIFSALLSLIKICFSKKSRL